MYRMSDFDFTIIYLLWFLWHICLKKMLSSLESYLQIKYLCNFLSAAKVLKSAKVAVYLFCPVTQYELQP